MGVLETGILFTALQFKIKYESSIHSNELR